MARKKSGFYTLKNALKQSTKARAAFGKVGRQGSTKNLASSSAQSVFKELESVSYVDSFLRDKERYKPNVDFSDPKNFVRFGSAEEYYVKAIENIYKTYPYDGSAKERYDWHNSSSYFDNYFFEYEYPRTNGFISIGQTWTVDGTADQDSTDKIVAASSPQYISIKGGPHGPSTPVHDVYSGGNLKYQDPKNKSNFYNEEMGQIQNLTIDGATGNTVEFWMKLPVHPSKSQSSPSHAYFDLWNGSTAITSTGDYGRFLIETRLNKSLNGAYVGDSIFYISYGSGSFGVSRAKIGPTTLSGTYGINLADWNHYAFVVQNNITGSDHLEMNLYINGTLIDTVHTGSQVAAVSTGPLNANIGAYRYNPIPSLSVSDGEGSISGSQFDEFRFWKTARSEKQISFNWFTQVAGGTNTDFGKPESKYSGSVNPIDLGVYFKFNEGTTGFTTQDRNIIDYSGRVSNGTYNNYSNNPKVRFEGSAIVSASAADREFKDPILYENHPQIVALTNNKISEGLEYDSRNPMSMYHMMPQWMLDEDSDKNRFEIKKLTQIISSYFDELYLQTGDINKLRNYTYISGSVSGSMYKPLPFANRLLESRGFLAPELFSTSDVLASFRNRDDKREFKTELANVKNQIYTNIYNNLDYINKSKGTEKSIRNLVRCFGVDDELYSLSFYANNAEISLNQSITPKIVTKNFVNFATASNFEALVYQSTASSNTNESMFITGSSNTSNFDGELGFTVETDVIFPATLEISNPKKPEMEYSPVSASLFGMHSALISPSSDGDTTWAPNDYASFQVYAAREENPIIGSQYSSNTVRFVLTGTNINSSTEAAFPYLISDKFEDVYDDEKWHFAVKVKPATYPNLGIVSGTSGFDVEFHGYNTQADIVINSFVLTGSLNSGGNVLASKKRLYIGAHRTNYTGSLIVGSNARISSCRYWALPLEKEEIVSHAIDISNYGLFDPMESAYLFQNYGVDIPKIRTLALSWDFNTVTGSNVNGEFFVQDFSSGSGDSKFRDDLSNLLLKQHTGRGLFFNSSNTNVISKQYVYSYKQQVPENLDSSDAVKILNKDQEFFTPRTKPVTFSFGVEKSMYQSISEDMLNFLACSAEASGLEGLIGDPINKYRSEYKLMKKIREIFFEKVGNTPDLDKYLEYYKWLDTSISSIIDQLVPASSQVDSVSNIVESHVFERNKYTHKFPTMEFDSNDPSGSINSINELLYDWEFGHAPLSLLQTDNCNWWNKRIDREDALVATGIADVDVGRANIHSASIQAFNRNFSRPYKISTKNAHERFKPQQNQKFIVLTEIPPFANTKTITFNTSTFTTSSAACDDDTKINPNLKRKADYQVEFSDNTNTRSKHSGHLVSPYSFYESTINSRPTGVPDGYQVGPDHLRDYYTIDKLVPMQGPFTKQHVGGHQHRNIGLVWKPIQINTPLDPRKDPRPEAWILSPSLAGGNLFYTIVNPSFFMPSRDLPRADFTRDFIAKSPINIKNIKTLNTTSSSSYGGIVSIGNYAHSYEIVQAPDRSINNRYFAENNGISTASVSSPFVSGLRDYNVPDRGRHAYVMVNRFSAPGGPETSAPGFLDYESETFSVYNALPFRNLTVRQPLRGFLTSHSIFGGLDSRTAASVRMVFTSNTLSNYDNNTIQITATNGNSKTYLFEDSGLPSRATGVIEGGTGRVFVQINGMSTSQEIASEFVVAMNHQSGINSGKPDSVIIVELKGDSVVDMRQAEPGSDGNTDITAATMITAGTIKLQSPDTGTGTRSGFRGGSGIAGQIASFHNTQRNGAKRIEQISIFPQGNTEPVRNVYATRSVFDNYWIQHMIPQSDFNYAWITASATSAPFGYSKPDLSNASLASTDIEFITSSEASSFLVYSDHARHTVAFGSDLVSGFDNRTVTIISTVGLTKTYKFTDDAGEGSTGSTHSDGSSIVVQINGMSSRDAYAQELQTAINGTTGHNAGVPNSVLQVGYDSPDLTIVQSVPGPGGFNAQPGTVAWSGNPSAFDIATSSASDNKHRMFSVQPNGGVYNTSSSDLESDKIAVSFVGLNTHFIDTLDLNTNTISNTSLNTDFINGGVVPDAPFSSDILGTVGTGSFLNSINLRRNGAGGFSSWKQIRQSHNPIIRYNNKNNIISLMTQSVVVENNLGPNLTQRDLIYFKEPSVTFCYKPLKHNVTMNNGETIVIKNTYANNLHTFSNKKINQLINFEAEKGEEVYDDLKRIYVDNALGEYNPISSLNSLEYKEKIYPRKVNTGLSRTRGREFYTVNRDGKKFGGPEIRRFHEKMGTSIAFWKNDINDRLRNDAGSAPFNSGRAVNAQGVPIFSASSPLGLIDLSIWPLDAEEPFFDYYLVSASADLSNSGFDSYYWSPMGPSGAMLNPALEPRWNNASKNGELSYAGWLISLYNFNLDGKFALDGTSGGRGPLTSVRAGGARVTASFQYEYPNMIWSGSFPYGQRWDDEYGSGGNDLAFMINQASASLHLIPPYRADVLSGRTPWFNSYEDYAEDIRLMAKDYTILPEFKISDHIEYYINNGFKSQNNKLLDLLGSNSNSTLTSSAATEISDFNNRFFTLYTNSDFLSKFVEISEDHKKNATAAPSEITLKVNAVKKLLPYQGFYPALRAVQLGQLFSASYSPHISGSNNYASVGASEAEAFNERLAALYQPFFAPGIFFNTIKSGIAVDYPVHTGSVPSTLGDLSSRSGRAITNILGVNAPFSASNTNLNMLTDDPNFSFPFEAILNPNRFLPITASSDFRTAANVQDELEGYTSGSVFFVYPHFTGSLDTTANPSFADPWDATSASATASNKRPEIFFTWNGESSVEYSLAANNFFAEVENLFLERRSPTSFVSRAEKDFVSMASGSVYMMDVVLSKTEDFVSYEGPSGSFNFIPFTGSTNPDGDPSNLLGRGRMVNNKVSVRGMHYGPPYIAQPDYFGNPDSGSAYFEDPCYAPHTPPYFYGDAVARIIIRPDQIENMEPNSTRKFELRDMLANAEIQTKYFNTNKLAKDLQNPAHKNGFPAGRYQMQVSSSIDLFGSLTLKQVNYKTEQDKLGNFIPDGVQTTVLQDSQDAWVIESKFECPSINLNDMDVLALGAGSNGKERLFTRGIWKGYGNPPTGSDGIYIQLRESDPRRVNNTQFMNAAGTAPATGSLIKVCGFQADKVRVGEIASKREISEAIVAIPINSDGEFYTIDQEVFDQQAANIKKGEPAVKQGQFGATQDIQETSISDMINKINKFYLPPQLDPIRNPSATPVVMYIFDFKHTLSKSDLSYIWQNLMPDIAITAERDQSVIQHNLKRKYEFFGNSQFLLSPFSSISNDVRWMVFKVKQRAKNNYNNVTKKSESSVGFSFTSEQELAKFSSSPDKELDYSFNWPYDFFSLVELAQLEVGYTFTKPDVVLPSDQPQNVVAGNAEGQQGGQNQVSSQTVADSLKNAGL